MSISLAYSSSIGRRLPLIEGMTRDELVEAYIPKVRLIANMVKGKVGAQVDFDDLLHAGMIGLLDAIDKYDDSHKTRFSTYAEFRIRGAILDSLRSLDLLTRTSREKANKLKKTLLHLNSELGREPTQNEVAKAMSMSMEEYHRLLDQVKSITLCNLDDTQGDDEGRSYNETISYPDEVSALDALSDASMRAMVKDGIKKLPDRLKQIILLYYYKNMNMKEIGKTLGLSESRICQLHTEAILRLKARTQRALDV